MVVKIQGENDGEANLIGKSLNHSSDACSKCCRKQLGKQDSQKKETHKEEEEVSTTP